MSFCLHFQSQTKKMKYIYIAISLSLLAMTSCLDSGDETIALAVESRTDIPSDSYADPNPLLTGTDISTLPNIQYATVDENGTAVFQIDMPGLQDPGTNEWLRLYGTADSRQNVWVEVDDSPKGIAVRNVTTPLYGTTQESYIIRFTNIGRYVDGRTHRLRITVVSADKTFQAQRTYNVTMNN